MYRCVYMCVLIRHMGICRFLISRSRIVHQYEYVYIHIYINIHKYTYAFHKIQLPIYMYWEDIWIPVHHWSLVSKNSKSVQWIHFGRTRVMNESRVIIESCHEAVTVVGGRSGSSSALFACVAVCCSVFQRVAVCCSASQCVAVCCPPCVCCSVLQCVAVCCSVLQRVAVCCSVLQCVALTVVDCMLGSYKRRIGRGSWCVDDSSICWYVDPSLSRCDLPDSTSSWHLQASLGLWYFDISWYAGRLRSVRGGS